MRAICLAVCLLMLAGCSCFRVCPDVPPPPAVSPTPDLCYPRLRSTDPAKKVLECYINDIVTLEGAVRERDQALGAYR